MAIEEFDGRQIITKHEYPPIPDRRFDWRAWFDGEEEGGLQGWGTSEDAAIEALIENLESEQHDPRDDK
jgi:hypothetical protein